MVGETLGHYEILEPLGAGGMGEVYRARDTKLDRDVAIKVLPEDFATDQDRLARFEREAKLLASLNHANIAAIYGLEDEGDQRFIVMEVVEGETLAERIARSGRIEVEEALDIARQIAEALEAAHENGVVHRDLKPANVIVTPDGKVKVLDFGLAKAYKADGAAAEVSPDLSHSPTMAAATRTGLILGTAAYMSPEQARGKPVDKRTDIFAFGALLYEMLTGRAAFDGETVTDVLASVVKEEPQWDGLPAETPPPVRSLLRRCLGKDPTRRMHDIADARLEIEEAVARPDVNLSVSALDARQSPRWRRAAPWALTSLLAVVTLVTVYQLASLPTSAPPLVQQYSIRLNPGAPTNTPSQVTVSPDGRHVSYQANLGDGWRLYHRPIEEIDARRIPGLDRDSYYPRFSPDEQWITFGRESKLWRVHLSGGEPTMIHDFNVWKTWESDESLLIGHRNSIWRIPATGASLEERELVAEPDPATGIAGYDKPAMLPDGKGILVELRHGAEEAGTAIGAISFETGEVVTVAPRGNDPRFSRSGHVLYARETTIEAVPFSVERFEVTGPAIPVLEGVAFNPGNGDSEYDVSENGLLIFVPGQSITGDRRLAWVDHGGTETLVDDEARTFEFVRLSPDGTQLAVDVYDEEGYSIWLYSLAAGSWSKLTDESGHSPLWSPDGRHVLYTARKGTAGSPFGLFRKAADFSGEREELATSDGPALAPWSWSIDGSELVFTEDPFTGEPQRILVMPVEGDGSARLFLGPDARFDQSSPMVSPDGNWIVYVSNQSGGREVYVRPFPGGGARYPVSDGGGAEPMWSPDGQEIFYRDGTHMIAAQVETTPDFRVVGKEALFRDVYFHTLDWMYRIYDYDARSKSFLMADYVVDEDEWDAAAAADLHVIVNFFEVLKRLAPPNR